MPWFTSTEKCIKKGAGLLLDRCVAQSSHSNIPVAGEVGQRLEVHSAHTNDPNMIFSTHFRWFTTTWIFNSGYAMFALSSLDSYTHTHRHMHTHTHTYAHTCTLVCTHTHVHMHTHIQTDRQTETLLGTGHRVSLQS